MGTEIVQAPVRPLVSAEEAAKRWAEFEALKASLLTGEDYQVIGGKRYIRRSGLRKLGVFFGVSDRILEKERTEREDGSFVWRVVVEVVAPNGRMSVGVGACDSKERGFAHAEHDVFATAHTRSKSRGISDLVAGGAVSAEEVVEAPGEAPAAPTIEARASPAEPVPETPVGVEPRAAPTTWKPRVPMTKEVLTDDSIRQFPLADGVKAVGMFTVLKDGSEASLMPDSPVSMEDPAITWLFRVIGSMVEKHPGLEYTTETTDGFLTALLMRGTLEEKQIKDLKGAGQWAFAKALAR